MKLTAAWLSFNHASHTHTYAYAYEDHVELSASAIAAELNCP